MAEFLKLMENWTGFSPVSDRQINEATLARLVDLIANKDRMPAHGHEYLMKEVVTTSDFPTLFGVAIDRQMLARYRTVAPDWRSYVKTSRLPNFNVHDRNKVSGQDNLLVAVPEKHEYPLTPSATSHYHIHLDKYGRRFNISFEAIINDSMGAFADIPVRFADAATRSVTRFVTGLYASAAGPNVGLFGAPITDVDGQNVTNLGALPLTVGNLQATLALMAQQVDVNGEVISVRGTHLVVPPALEYTARAILTSAFVAQIAGAVALPTTNIVPQLGIKLHVDPYLPIIDVSGNRNGTWYMFAEPSEAAALEVAFLTGNEDPEICMKASDKMSVGGGLLSPFSGDFDTDDIEYRVRMIFGGTQLDPRYAYAQVSA